MNSSYHYVNSLFVDVFWWQIYGITVAILQLDLWRNKPQSRGDTMAKWTHYKGIQEVYWHNIRLQSGSPRQVYSERQQ